MSVHPRFLEFVREFRSYFTVEKNPHPQDEWDQWFICAPVKRLEPVYGVHGLFGLMEYPYPVLSVPQVMEVDVRIHRALHEALWENQRDAGDIVTEQRRQVMLAHEENVDNWARGPGYWHFKKWINQFNLGNIDCKDPTRGQKDLEDKLGRELNR